MKIRSVLVSLAFAAALLATGGKVNAQVAGNNPLITVDENGVGSILFAGSPATPLTGVLAPDPGPGGLASALTYNLLGPPSLVAGDLIVLDPGGGSVSDVVRFNPANANTGYPASLVFYSLSGDSPHKLADTGFPLSFYTNLFTTVESAAGTATYTPTTGQPGFVSGFSVTYSIVSDAVVPEPASIVLFGTGTFALCGYAWRRRKLQVA